MSSGELIVVGAGGYAREVASYAKHAGYKVIGFEEEPRHEGETLSGLPVKRRFSEKCLRIIAYGDPKKRLMVAKLHPDDEYATIVHPTAVIGDNVKLEKGVAIGPGCVLSCDITIGEHAHLNSTACVYHDVKVGAFAILQPNATVLGKVVIGEGTYIGASATIRENLHVGNWSFIGMGSVVTKDIPDNVLAYGNPARKMSEVPSHLITIR